MSAYTQLSSRFERIGKIDHALSILDWDEATMMPEGAVKSRAQVTAELQLMKHEIANAPQTIENLKSALESEDQLNDWERANLHLIHKSVQKARALPARLIEAMTVATSRAQMAWRTHRAENNFREMAPLLTEIFRLKREEAKILSDLLQRSPYEALMDSYESDLRKSDVDPLFDDLKSFLPSFLEKALKVQSAEKVSRPTGPFPTVKQREVADQLINALGFDRRHGRLDVSHHPFCGGTPRDVRITTRYDESDFFRAMMGVLHETGHAKYEQGLPDDWVFQPVGRSLGMMIHESQSLLSEMQICRGRSFLEFSLPLFKKAFASPSDTSNTWSLENFFRLSTFVARGYIRVDADEVTYPLHVLLRYEIEKNLIDGQMEVKDVPEAWDQSMKDLLNLDTRGNYKNGCLQDVHWQAGLVGYFPCYTLGALVAAQLYQQMEKDIANLKNDLSQGSFSQVNAWLNKNIYQKASLYSARDLIQEASGAPLSTKAFKAHLENRYIARSR